MCTLRKDLRKDQIINETWVTFCNGYFDSLLAVTTKQTMVHLEIVQSDDVSRAARASTKPIFDKIVRPSNGSTRHDPPGFVCLKILDKNTNHTKYVTCEISPYLTIV